jgi:hypothetical protein
MTLRPVFAAALLAVLAGCSEREQRDATLEARPAAPPAALVERATEANGGKALASTLAPFTVAPAMLNGSAAPLQWGSHLRAPREVQAPVGSGAGLAILESAASFDVTIAGAEGHHLYVECNLQPSPRRDVRFESVVSGAGPSVGTMTFDQASNLYFAVTPVVQPGPDRPNANFTISGPSADPSANISLRSCTVLPFKAG